jgi:hypothetical protein
MEWRKYTKWRIVFVAARDASGTIVCSGELSFTCVCAASGCLVRYSLGSMDRFSQYHAPHCVPVLATSSITMCTSARHIIHQIAYWYSPRHPPLSVFTPLHDSAQGPDSEEGAHARASPLGRLRPRTRGISPTRRPTQRGLRGRGCLES